MSEAYSQLPIQLAFGIYWAFNFIALLEGLGDKGTGRRGDHQKLALIFPSPHSSSIFYQNETALLDIRGQESGVRIFLQSSSLIF